ncbi:glycoside hydrolase family 31 protein [Labilibaculum euxinus]
MKLKHMYILLLLVFSLYNTSKGQSYKHTDLGIKTVINSTEIEIQFYGPSTVRILKFPEGDEFEKKSLSVIMQPQEEIFDIQEMGKEITLKSKKISVALNLKNGQVAFKTISGEPLLNEKAYGGKFTDFIDAGDTTYSVSQSYVLDENEAIYGLGILQRGKMSQRNQKVRMVQNNTEDYVPFFLSEKGYGVYWDNYSPTTFKDNSESTSFSSEVGDGIDYYFMYGGNSDGVIACMRNLTGQVPMFPLWTFGYWQSKERYKSQNEIVGVVEKYRELGVPLDGIIQDWQYWGNNYLWNAMEFLNPDFAKPQKMVNDIHDLNAHIIISIWSSFGPMTKPYREMNPKGMLLNIGTWPQSGLTSWPPNKDYPSGVKPYDPYNPEARDIYWKYLNQGIFKLGMDGWWMDSTEPDHLDFRAQDMDNKTYLGSFRKVRNAYPLMTVGGVYEHQREVSSDKRVFILTRSAFAGQQRYGANTWSGDVSSSWESLRNQIPAGLNFSLCGIPYWNSDIGGFFAGAYNKNWNDGSGSKNPLYQELYVRWLQFGAFTPMMRSHGTDVPREIYQFGKKGEPIYDAIEKIIHLRYSLLPYIYATAWDVTKNQSSFMRALVMDFNDENVKDLRNEYMFGKSILVAPIDSAQYTPEKVLKIDADTGWDKAEKEDTKSNTETNFRKSKFKNVYLPAGEEWYDFWTNEKYLGGQNITATTTIDKIPLYIKAGSILPLGPKVKYATEKKWDKLEIRIYEGANGEFTLYEDENDNYNYEKGMYSTITFNWNDAEKVLTINDREGNFPGMLKERTFGIVKVDKGKVAGDEVVMLFDKVVKYNGKKVLVKF